MGLQIVASTMVDNAGKPVPESARAGIAELAERLKAHPGYFGADDVNDEFEDHERDEIEGADDEFEDEDGGPFVAAEVEYDPDFDDVYAPEGDGMVMTEDVLARMFANLIGHGLEVG